MTIVYYTNSPPGTIVNCFPLGSSLEDWSTDKVLLTEAASPNTGRWSGDLSVGYWAVFEGSSQPSDFFESKGTIVVAASGLDAAGVRAAVGLASANLDTQLAGLNTLLTAGDITSHSPVTTAGTLSGPIVIGDDYLAASGRAFDWFVDPGVFDISEATCWFGGALASNPERSAWLVEGDVEAVTVSGQPKWRLRFELATADTLGLRPDTHNWSVELRGPTGPENITKILGTASVADSYTQ